MKPGGMMMPMLIAPIAAALIATILDPQQRAPLAYIGGTLGVLIGAQHRHPATFYVAVSYMCWACRRKEMTIRNGEAFHDPA